MLTFIKIGNKRHFVQSKKPIIKKIIRHIKQQTKYLTREHKETLHMVLSTFENSDNEQITYFIFLLNNYKDYFDKKEHVFLPDITIKIIELITE